MSAPRSSYFAALADGNLDRLRALTCPSYHDGFFGKVDPEQYRSVHDNEAAAGGAVVLDSIDSVLLAPPTATAQVTAHTQAVPERKQLVLALRQSDGAWQICDPEAER